MKKMCFALLLVIATTFTGCTNSCEETLCFTPPNPFTFELVDKDSRENIFTNGTFSENQIRVVTTSTSEGIPFSFISENNINRIVIGSIGWETETIEFNILIADRPIIRMSVTAERKTENCCAFTSYTNITPSDAEYEYTPATDTYTVLVQL